MTMETCLSEDSDCRCSQKIALGIKKRTSGILGRVPLSLAEKISTIAPLIPFYHLVSDERLGHVWHLFPYKNVGQFRQDLDLLCSRYEPVSLTDILDHVRNGKKLNNASFLLTFDDGYSQAYSVVAPILMEKGVPAVFFLTANCINNRALSFRNKASLIYDVIVSNKQRFMDFGSRLSPVLDVPFQDLRKKILSIPYKGSALLDDLAVMFEFRYDEYLKRNRPYLDSEQIERLVKMGFHIGSHSADHPSYQDLSLEEQIVQTIGSLQSIRKEFNLPYSVFAFPFHDRTVSKSFFDRIESQVDLAFGSCGARADSVPWNLQRIDFERGREPASRILARSFMEKRIRQLLCRAEIKRA